jgi:leader peptidase (prepilin peptidase)/N-methyltransferase
VGSFLNVVIYRLPRDKSLVTPPSACPACGKHIRFYDNIPLLSWLLLGRKCRYCKSPISPRYFVIELLTGLTFAGLFILYFRTDLLAGVKPFLGGGWFIYLLHIIMLSAFIAASAIDLKLWIIPLSICWFVTAIGLVGSAVGVYIINPAIISGYNLLPGASANTGLLAIGAAIGLAISLILLKTGLIKRSYECQGDENLSSPQPEPQFNHRREVCKEVIFLLPVLICSSAVYWTIQKNSSLQFRWLVCAQYPVVTGFLGSLWGYLIGCGIVWITRILGTLALGKEAMGLGDVHLMGAAGAVIGPTPVVAAFFIAPFFGLAWAAFQMLFKKVRQIPYGPFLSLGILAVIILHDRIFYYLNTILYN